MRWTIFTLAAALCTGAVQAQGQSHALTSKTQGVTLPAPIGMVSWFTRSDIPQDAMHKGQPNPVRFSLKVNAFGTPTGCEIMQTSGIAELDRATCRLALRRARFRPMINEAGVPVESTFNSAILWDISPDEAAVPAGQ